LLLPLIYWIAMLEGMDLISHRVNMLRTEPPMLIHHILHSKI
jgi:hypothetical protein